MGNLNALRDWGHAKDFVKAQWMMLQQDQPDDFVIATGEQHSVRAFIDTAANALGMRLAWEGDGMDEVAYWTNSPTRAKDPIIKIDPRLFRPTEVETLLGDPLRQKENLVGSLKFHLRNWLRIW